MTSKAKHLNDDLPKCCSPTTEFPCDLIHLKKEARTINLVYNGSRRSRSAVNDHLGCDHSQAGDHNHPAKCHAFTSTVHRHHIHHFVVVTAETNCNLYCFDGIETDHVVLMTEINKSA